MRVALTAVLLALAASPPALAQAAPATSARPAPDRPPLLPTREASVLYRVVASGSPPVEVRITTQANGAAMRIDMPDRSYMLVNQAEKRMAMVVPDELTVMDLPFQPGLQDQFQLNARMRFTRRPAETVAGLRCTSWDVLVDGSRGIMCVTDDGVLLRSISLDPAGRRNVIEAISVSYAPALASDFLPPEGFDHMAAPVPGTGAVQ